MNEPEIQHLIENDLRRAVGRHGAPPQADPLQVSPWVAMSLLQKAIRRGQEDLALRAAATLLRDAPERLWRRLGCIAPEDIGLGNLNVLALATAALAGKRLRSELGGEWTVASCVVRELARATKCRAADDLLVACEVHPACTRQRVELRGLPTRELIEIICGSGPLYVSAVALWCALGGGPRSLEYRRPRGEAQMVFDHLCEAGWPHSIVEIARRGYRATGELLSPFVALLSHELTRAPQVEAEQLPPEVMIRDIPGWAYDLYTREGRAAFARFLQTDAASATWLRRHVKPGRRVPFLGHIVFRVEGGLVDRRMQWSLGDRLRRVTDVECSGPECRDIPLLNEVRDEVIGGARHGR
jgi:hypothetical protein